MTHETSLDLRFVAKAAEFAAPVKLPSQWVVRVETYFLGGGRHFYSRQIADIGVVIQLRRGQELLKSKIALLLSKRLYAQEEGHAESQQVDYEIGFARLFYGDTAMESITVPRTFTFAEDSRYQALKVGDDQYCGVKSYESKYGIPVYYMLYHPPQIPFWVEIPRRAGTEVVNKFVLGTRVLPSADVRAALVSKPNGYMPSFEDLRLLRPTPEAHTTPALGWPIEEFIADLAIDCKAGYVPQQETDEGLFRIFHRRHGPIAASIAITLYAPPCSQSQA